MRQKQLAFQFHHPCDGRHRPCDGRHRPCDGRGLLQLHMGKHRRLTKVCCLCQNEPVDMETSAMHWLLGRPSPVQISNSKQLSCEVTCVGGKNTGQVRKIVVQ